MSAKGRKIVRCAIYTRVSTDQGLEQDFNSLDAQYAGWTLVRNKYDDGGGNTASATAFAQST